MSTVELWRRLLNTTSGRFFSVQFVKKNGKVRKLNGKLHQHLMPTDVDSSGHVVVWDTQKAGYRKVNLQTITEFVCGQLVI